MSSYFAPFSLCTCQQLPHLCGVWGGKYMATQDPAKKQPTHTTERGSAGVYVVSPCYKHTLGIHSASSTEVMAYALQRSACVKLCL